MKTERKMLIATVLVAIILFNCLLPVLKVSATTDIKVTFESNLYSALKEELTAQQINAAYIDEQRTIIINEEEIAKVTHLSLSNANLTDLTGLDTFKNVTKLELSANQLNKDSNLEVLNSLQLDSLDLSSNEIEDVSMIANLDNIANIKLHNQKFNVVHIIELDTTNESNQTTQVSFPLPQIINKAGYLQTEWLVEETSGTPYINWSKFDHKNIKVEVAYKSGSTYVPYKDMVTLRINISDTTNMLYNSDINMFFVVVDSDERGIHIPDKNMYIGIKEQLKKNQRLNSELISYYATTPSSLIRNLYERTYDEPQVLVITIDDIINKIQNLDLSDKKIRKLDGIEKFVGLETELDLSGNYIKSIDKLIELQENQAIEEQKLRERVREKLGILSSTLSEMTSINASIKAEEKIMEELYKKKAELEEKCQNLEEELSNLRDEKSDLEEEKANLISKIEVLQKDIKEQQDLVEDINSEIADLNKNLVSYKAEKTKLEEQLVELQNELKKLEENLNKEEEKVKEAIESKEKEIEIKQAEINSKQSEIDAKQAEIDAKQEEVNSKVEEISQKQEEINTKTTTIAIYDVRISEIIVEIEFKQEEYEETIKSLELSEFDSIYMTEEEIQAIIEEMIQACEDNQIEDIPEGMENYPRTDYQTINAKVDVLSTKVTDLDSTEDDIVGQIKIIRDSIETAINNINHQTDDNIPEVARTVLLEDYNEKLNSLENLSNISIRLNNEFKEKVREFVQILLDEKDRLQEEIDKIRNEIEEEGTGLEDQKADLEDQKADLEDQKTNLEDQKADLEDQKADLVDQLNTLNEELKDLKDTLENIEDTEAYKAIQNQIDQKQAEIDAKQAEIDTKQSQIVETETDIIELKNQIESINKKIADLQKELSEKQSELAEKERLLAEKEAAITAKVAEIAKIVEELNVQEESIAQSELKMLELQKNLDILNEILLSQMAALYKIYNRIDKLASFATSELKLINSEEFDELTFEKAKSMFNAQIQKIASIESYLTEFEYQYLIDKYSIPTENSVTVEKTIQKEDGTTEKITETKIEEIEKPISKYFNELNARTQQWNLFNYKSYLESFRTDDVYFSMAAYCYITRLYENITTCKANDYVDREVKILEFDGYSTDYLVDARNTYNSVIRKYNYSCSGKAKEYLEYNYASRIVASSSDVDVYVCIPRIKALNVSENLIENIDRISELKELRKLYAYDNELVDISTVNWSSMTKLKVLDLGFNGISDIKPLEVLSNIEELSLKGNLLSGTFDFEITNFENLKLLDVSENRYDDIEKLIQYLTYEARANGFYDVATFLNDKDTELDIRFNNQILSLKVDRKFEINENRKIELPKIFRQIEEIDYANTSFGINSINGNVTNDGKEVLLDTTREGNITSVVTIINNGMVPSMGSGTTCTIYYTVGSVEPVNVIITPEDGEVYIGKTLQFTAEVTGDNVSYKGVRWELEGATSASTTISNTGLLTVGLDETAANLVIKATSLYDETKSAEVEVAVVQKEVTSVKITPETTTIVVGQNKEFTAEVLGTNLEDADKGVTWEVYAVNENNEQIQTTFAEGTKATFKDNKLTLYIGQEELVNKFVVKAISVFDNTKVAQSTVVVERKQVSGIRVTPDVISVEKGKTQEFNVVVTGENLSEEDKGVTYTITGNTSNDTKISNDGILTIASNEKANKIRVKITSNYDDTKVVEVIVTVLASSNVGENLGLGYETEEDYIVGVKTKTPVDAFKEEFAKDYTVIVKSNGEEVTTGYMKTGMYVEVRDKNNNLVKDEGENFLVFEVVVTGDVNSDGVADAIDSNLIKAIRNEVATVLEIQKKAADIDNNGEIDLTDSKLLLYHRAEVKDYCLDYTK